MDSKIEKVEVGSVDNVGLVHGERDLEEDTIVADDARLAELGYKSEFRREFSVGHRSFMLFSGHAPLNAFDR